jgi:hypothetical protein
MSAASDSTPRQRARSVVGDSYEFVEELTTGYETVDYLVA